QFIIDAVSQRALLPYAKKQTQRGGKKSRKRFRNLLKVLSRFCHIFPVLYRCSQKERPGNRDPGSSSAGKQTNFFIHSSFSFLLFGNGVPEQGPARRFFRRFPARGLRAAPLCAKAPPRLLRRFFRRGEYSPL